MSRKADKMGVTIKDGAEIVGNTDDLGAVCGICVQGLREWKNEGNTPKYPDTEQGFEAFRQQTINYFQYIQATNAGEPEKLLFADIEGLCCFLGITRTLLFKYRKRGGQWESFIDYVKECVFSFRKQAVSTFRSPPVWEIFNATNNFQYVNANEFKLQAETIEKKESMRSPEQIEIQYGSGATAELPEFPEDD